MKKIIICVYNDSKKYVFTTYSVNKKKYHCVMKKEAITFLKTIVYVAIGVLIANTIERKYLKSKTIMPMDAVK